MKKDRAPSPDEEAPVKDFRAPCLYFLEKEKPGKAKQMEKKIFYSNQPFAGSKGQQPQQRAGNPQAAGNKLQAAKNVPQAVATTPRQPQIPQAVANNFGTNFGITAAHRKRQQTIAQELCNATSASQLVCQLEKYRLARFPPIKFSSVMTKIGTFHGAIKRMDSENEKTRLKKIVSDPLFQDYEKEVQHKKIEEEVSYPKPLAKHHVTQTLANLKRQCRFNLFSFLLLAWATSQRPACVLRLKTANVTQKGPHVSCLFVEGKGVRSRKQAFHIATTIGDNQRVLQTYLATREHHEYMFPQNKKDKIYNELRSELRKADPAYEMRSSRRGSLVHLADAGTTIPTLMQFSGHGCEKTLLRYLVWGRHLECQNKQTQQSSRLLF